MKKTAYTASCWCVALRKGHHEPLISFATHERIQAVLKGTANAPARKDINADFPLRGFVLCDDCNQPMTSLWSNGRNTLYPYFLCDTASCASKRKSFRRADIEEGAKAILRKLQPARQICELARAIFPDICGMRLKEARAARKTIDVQIKETKGQTGALPIRP